MSLLPRLFVLLMLLLPVSTGRAQGPASKDPKTIIIRDTEPEKDLETGMAKPPEPAIPPEEAYVDSSHRWKFKDGRQVELYAAGWEWKEREGPKGGRQWVLCLIDSGYRGNSFREKLSYPADEFEPTEAKNVIKWAWKVYYVESKREKARLGY